MTSSKGVNFEMIQAEMEKNPALKQILEYLAGRDRAYTNTSFMAVRRNLAGLTNDEVHKCFAVIQQAGAGKILKRKNYLDFIWNFELKDVAKKALGQIPVEQSLKPAVYPRNKLPPKAPAANLTEAAVKTNMTRGRRVAAPRTVAAEPSSSRVGFITIRGDVNGRPAEFEIDLAKVPPEAYRFIRVL